MRSNSTDAGARGAYRQPYVAFFVSLLLSGCLAPTPAAAQTLAERYAPLMRIAPEPPNVSRLRHVRPDPIGVFGSHLLRANFQPEQSDADAQARWYDSQPDGQPLRAQQVPRFLRPTHNGFFGFNNFLVLGDHPTVTFERWDWDEEEQTTRWRRETWRRATTRAVRGRLVSVFHPKWPARVLQRRLRLSSWGVDKPALWNWGRLLLPGTDGETRTVSLSMVPPNIPASPVVRINDRVQYASHVVNLRAPDFGEGGERTLNQYEIVRRFLRALPRRVRGDCPRQRRPPVELVGRRARHREERHPRDRLASVRPVRGPRQRGCIAGGGDL